MYDVLETWNFHWYLCENYETLSDERGRAQLKNNNNESKK